MKNLKSSLLFLAAFFVIFVPPVSRATTPSPWSFNVIASGVDFGFFGDSATDSNGALHVVYVQYDHDVYLKYATNKSGAWVTDTVDNTEFTSSSASMSPSIAVDSSGRIHISYCNAKGYLKYATAKTVLIPWAISTVDNSKNVGQYSSIALDSAGNIHISYSSEYGSESDAAVKYATNVSGSWATSTVDSAVEDDSIFSPSIVIDSSDNIFITYQKYDYDKTLGKIVYATTKQSNPFNADTPPLFKN